jgi:hypothetical protein
MYSKYQTARRHGYTGEMCDWRIRNRGEAYAETDEAYKLLSGTNKVKSFAKLVCKHDGDLLFRRRDVKYGCDSGVKVVYNENVGYDAANNVEKTSYGRIVSIFKHTLHDGPDAPSRVVLDVEWFGEHTVSQPSGLRVVEDDPHSAFNAHWRLTFLDGLCPKNIGFLPYPPTQVDPTIFAVIDRHELSDIQGDFTDFGADDDESLSE